MILYLGYRLDKAQTAPALSKNRWSFDEMESDLEDTDNEDDIEVREEIETRGLAGKVSLLCEVSWPSVRVERLELNQPNAVKENKELRESVGRLELNRRLLEERVERLETWVSQTEPE